MELLIIDGQGGGIGRGLVERLRARFGSGLRIIAVGTNALATSAMLRAGADVGATGENAICYNCARAGLIAGPIGLVIANSMFGELTPAMARAVGESPAQRILIPVSRCRTWVAGVQELPSARYLDDAVERIARCFAQEESTAQ
ncbi:MAG: DUF3842 family protein [Oscillospiraceae bacterium]